MNEFIIESVQRNVKRGYFVVNGENVPAKECTKCATPKTYENFTPNKGLADGYMNVCKKCKAERQKSYAKENPEVRRKSERKWRESNPDKVREMSKRSRELHADGYRERLRKWKRNNRDKVNIDTQRRRARVNSLPVNFSSEWASMLNSLYKGCAVTGVKEDLHWDHFIPISSGYGGTTFNNMIPLHSKVNIGKNDRNPLLYFFNGSYDENKILDTLAILAFLNDLSVDDYIDYVNSCFKGDEKANVEEIKRKAEVRNRIIDAVSANINI